MYRALLPAAHGYERFVTKIRPMSIQTATKATLIDKIALSSIIAIHFLCETKKAHAGLQSPKIGLATQEHQKLCRGRPARIFRHILPTGAG
jgi:hypothetical protein